MCVCVCVCVLAFASVVAQSQGRYAEAQPLYERSLAIWEQTLGADHPSVATSLNNLAGLYKVCSMLVL